MYTKRTEEILNRTLGSIINKLDRYADPKKLILHTHCVLVNAKGTIIHKAGRWDVHFKPIRPAIPEERRIH